MHTSKLKSHIPLLVIGVTHTRTHARTHVRTHARKHTDTQTDRQTDTHTHTHTHTHGNAIIISQVRSFRCLQVFVLVLVTLNSKRDDHH